MTAGSGGNGNDPSMPVGGNYTPPEYTQASMQGMMPRAGPVYQLKPKEPPIFRGNVEQDVETWLMSVYDFFRAIGVTGGIDGVNYMVTLLDGIAKDWWHEYLRTHGNIIPSSVQEFSGELRQRFASGMREQRARNELRHITIRSQESCRQYAARFQSHLQKIAHYDSHVAFDQFVSGLPHKAQEAIIMAGIRDLNEAIKKAEQLEMASNYFGQKSGHTSGHSRGGDRGRVGNTGSRGRGRYGGKGPQSGQQSGGYQTHITQYMRGRGRSG